MAIEGNRQKIGLVIIVVAVAVTAVALIRSLGNREPGTSREAWNSIVMCKECGHKWPAELNIGQPQAPRKCPSCGKDAGWECRYCTKCSEYFVPELTGDPPHPVAIPKCPRCGDDKKVTSVGVSKDGQPEPAIIPDSF